MPVVNIRGLCAIGDYMAQHEGTRGHMRAPTDSDLLTTPGEHASGGIRCNVRLVLARTLTGVVRLSAPDRASCDHEAVTGTFWNRRDTLAGS